MNPLAVIGAILVLLLVGPAGCDEQGNKSGDGGAVGEPCLPTVPGSCLDDGLFCGEQSTCAACVVGTRNCDGKSDNSCECAGSCLGVRCTTSGLPDFGAVPDGVAPVGDGPSVPLDGAPGDGAGPDGGGPPTGQVDDRCPARTTAISAATTVSGKTSKRLALIAPHCELSDAFAQVVGIGAIARIGLVVDCTVTGAAGAVSLRSECRLTEAGCRKTGGAPYEVDLDPGRHDLVITTDAPATWSCKITFGPPSS